MAAIVTAIAIPVVQAEEREFIPTPAPPKAGQPFDDREVLRYFEIEGRRLLASKRVKALRAPVRRCAMPLPAPNKEAMALTQLAKQAEQATVILGEFFAGDDKSGVQFASAAGGFFIGPKGTILTSFHVVGEKDSHGFVAMTRDGRVFPVREAVAANPDQDLVALQLDVPKDVTFPTLSLAPTPALPGSNIVVMSHPNEHFWMLTTGIVSRNRTWRTERGTEHYTCITADFAKGSSGCPVLDECGNVVGVVNNTESVYYEDDGEKRQLDLQMVIKNTTPGWVARTLFASPAP